MEEKFRVLLIKEEEIKKTCELLQDFDIYYREAGYPNGSVKVKESYPSKINLHADMQKYAKLKGYNSVSEAIGKMGGSIAFKKSFQKEFQKTKI